MTRHRYPARAAEARGLALGAVTIDNLAALGIVLTEVREE